MQIIIKIRFKTRKKLLFLVFLLISYFFFFCWRPNLKMKLTAEFLKHESHNFDLECVYVLDLSRRGVRDLGDLRECANLELLNLSFNEINDLSSLSNAKMPKLQHLNLAFNQLKHLSKPRIIFPLLDNLRKENCNYKEKRPLKVKNNNWSKIGFNF